MTGTLQPAKHVDVFQPLRLRWTRAESPSVPVHHRRELDQLWTEASQSNPHLYDGPSVVITDLDQSADELVLTWAPVTYRYFMLRRIGVTCSPCLFAAVIQPTDTGALLVGRSSLTTGVPGRLHLPGGVVEPPTSHDSELDVEYLAREATRELSEETGISIPAESLTLRLVTHAAGGNVGIVFCAPPLPVSAIRGKFAEHRVRETTAGHALEFDSIQFVSTINDLAAIGGPYTDSVIPVVRHFESTMRSAPPSSHSVQ